MIAVAKLPTVLLAWKERAWLATSVSEQSKRPERFRTDCAALFPLQLFRQPVTLVICPFLHPSLASAPIVLEGVNT